MKNIRYYLIICTLALLVFLFAFRREKANPEKNTSHSKLLTVPECIRFCADPQNENRNFTVKGIYENGEQKDGHALIVLQSENPGVDSGKLYCFIRPEQAVVSRHLQKGTELVVSGKFRPGKDRAELQEVTILTENRTEEASTY